MIRKKSFCFALVMVIIFFFFNISCFAAWPDSTSMPSERYSHGTVESGGKIYVIGGIFPETGRTNSVLAYDPAQAIWVEKTPMPTARGNFGAAAINGTIYVCGGHDGSQTSRVEAYDTALDSWTTKSNMPRDLDNCSACSVNGKLYVIGGCCGFANTVYEYNPTTDKWTTKSPMPTARAGHRCSVVNNMIYVFGGHNTYSPKIMLKTVEMYDPATNTWARKSEMPTGRNYHESAVLNGKIYVFGGFTGWETYSSTVDLYEPTTDTWSSVDDPMATARAGFGSATIDSKIYAVGGMNDAGALSSMEFFDGNNCEYRVEITDLSFSGEHLFLKGILYDESGNPAAGKTIGVEDPIQELCDGQWKTTDAGGHFEHQWYIRDKAPGMYGMLIYFAECQFDVSLYIPLKDLQNRAETRFWWNDGLKLEFWDFHLTIGAHDRGSVSSSNTVACSHYDNCYVNIKPTAEQVQELTDAVSEFTATSGKKAIEEFVTTETGVVAVVTALSCLFPEPAITKLICGAGLLYLKGKGLQSVAKATIKTGIQSWDGWENDQKKAEALALADTGFLIYSVGTLDPGSAFVGAEMLDITYDAKDIVTKVVYHDGQNTREGYNWLSMTILKQNGAHVFLNICEPSSVLYVKKDGLCGTKIPCYTSIQKAINAAGSEVTIAICTGDYDESIVLNDNKSVTLTGGWDSSFSRQTANTTILKQAPKAIQGSIVLQMLNVLP